MSKKPRGKSGSAAGAAGSKWEPGLVAAAVDEDEWTTSITLVVPDQLTDHFHLDMLNIAIKSEARKLFGNVNRASLYEETAEWVKELGNPKNKKGGKDAPPFVEICETVRPILDNGDELPIPLLARLIKFKILHLKQLDAMRVAAEKKPRPVRCKSRAVSQMDIRAGSRAESRSSSRQAGRSSTVRQRAIPVVNEALSDKDKGGGGKGGKGKDKPKSGGKKGKGGKTPEPPSAKGPTKLKKRGEEDEKVYIDDEPLDGASFYIVISGFNSPHLLSHLAEINVFCDSVIKVKSDVYPPPPTPVPVDPNAPPKDEKTLAVEEEQRAKKDAVEKELAAFWRDYILLVNNAPDGSKLHDMAVDEVTIKREWIPENIEDDKDGEKKLTIGKMVFEEVAVKAYDILDLKRQHQNFLANLKLIHVPVPSELSEAAARLPTAPEKDRTQSSMLSRANISAVPRITLSQDGTGAQPVIGDSVGGHLTPDVDMRYYTDMMNSVPQESVSVPLIMHCMLEQIEASEKSKVPPSEVIPPARDDGLDHGLADHIGGLAFKLSLSKQERESLMNTFEPPKPKNVPFTQPTLINSSDDITFRTGHLDTVYGFNPHDSEMHMLERIPLINFLETPDLEESQKLERAARLQELLHFCVNEDLRPDDVDHIFKQFVFECMDMRWVEESGEVVPSPDGIASVVPWDDPYPYYRGMLPKDETVLNAAVEDDTLSGLSASPLPSDRTSPAMSDRNANLQEGGLAGSERPLSAPLSGSGSRPTTPSILKKDGSSRAGSSRNSVHFSDGEEAGPDLEGLESVNPMEELVPGAHKRKLDEWCFAEHFDRTILLQVMRQACFGLPYLDVYYHKRDHCLLVAMHNPSSPDLKSSMTWSTKVHTNVGVRNYQEYVAPLIVDWTTSEEAKYQAGLICDDVEQDTTDIAKAAANAAKDAKKSARSRSKSPKGGRKGSAKSQSPKPADDGVNNYITDAFIKEGTLKFQKMENDRIRQELEEEERLKAEKADKRGKSGKKTADSSKGGKKEDRKASSRVSKGKGAKEEPAADPVLEKKPDEPYIPFLGYDLGTSKLMHADGEVNTMFPTDGAIIRTERYSFIQGSTSVKTSVVKDGNVLSVHILEPADLSLPDPELTIKPERLEGEGEVNTEKADTEENEKGENKEESKTGLGKFAGFSANFCDGMTLSFSTHGDKGEPTTYKRYEPELYQPPVARSPSPAPDAAAGAKGSPKKGKKGGNVTPDPTVQVDEPEVVLESEPAPEIIEPPPFQPIHLTTPDGLSVGFSTEPNLLMEGQNRLLIRQCYPFKTMGKHPCEESRAPVMRESSRVIRCDGTVIKNMSNGDVTVLYADGAVSKLTDVPQGQNILQRPQTPNRASSARSQAATPTKRGRKGKEQKNQQSVDEIDPADAAPEFKGQWITTSPTGERHAKKLDGAHLSVTNALVSYASDPESGQMMISREDRVNIVTFPHDMKVVEHEDGTRITTFLKEIEESTENENLEETKPGKRRGTPMVINQQFIRVECPGYAAVEFNCYTSYCMLQFGSGTLMSITPTGSYHIYHVDGFNMEVDKDGRVLYVPNPSLQFKDTALLVPAKVGLEIPSYLEKFAEGGRVTENGYLMSHADPTVVSTVDPTGNEFTVSHDGVHNVTLSEKYTQELEDSQGKPVEYKSHAPRFFIVRPDLSGTELLRKCDIEKFLMTAESEQSTALIKEPVIECPDVTAITVLKPVLKDVSQKWFGSLSSQSIIPPGLRSRDLKTLPPREIKSTGPRFGTTVGRGLAVGSAMKPVNTSPAVIECPRKLEIRQIIQFKPVSEQMRAGLYGNLKLYGDFVCQRESHAAEIQATDPRSEEDKISSAALLEAQRNKIESGDIRSLYEKVTAPPVPSPFSAPRPRRTAADLARDRAELASERVHKKALQMKEIPPYFESELGKAFLVHNGSDPERMLKQMEMADSNQKTVNKSQPLPSIRKSNPRPDTDNESVVNKTRPYGPTPQAANGQGSPGNLRPLNPTPAHAVQNGGKPVQRPSNPTPANAADGQTNGPIRTTPQTITSIPELNISPNSPADALTQLDNESPKFGPLSMSSSLQYDVIGQPRTQPVHVPDYLTKSGKPNMFNNDQFLVVEEGVRRQVKTSSVANVKMRGFELFPDSVDFGILKEGNTYSFTVFLKNVGIDSCRYKLRSPPPSTGLKLIYVPGLIAAGMKVEVKLELYAIANGVAGETGTGTMSHDLEIVTETSIMYLPVTATVLTSDEYERQAGNLSNGGMKPGVQFVTDQPSNGYGITRPRKDLRVASNNSDAILSMT